MKINNKGILKIEQNENGLHKVVFKPVNSTVWLRRTGLPELFGVNTQTIDACLEAILKDNIVDAQMACRYDLYVGGRRIKHDIREVRFDMIIAMVFRIDSLCAKVLREWFVKRSIHPQISDLPLPEIQHFWLN